MYARKSSNDETVDNSSVKQLYIGFVHHIYIAPHNCLCDSLHDLLWNSFNWRVLLEKAR